MNQLQKIVGRISFFISFILIFSGCEHIDNQKYIFIGDSIIARWPVDETFPSRLVYNYGKSGAGITYIAEAENRFNGNDVVVMIGTNDNIYFYSDRIDSYADAYVDAISKLTDRKIYLFSVLPREFINDVPDINDRIENFNKKIQESLVNYSNITYIDVYSDFLEDNHINYQYFSDGLHLNIYGYEVLSSYLSHKLY